MRLLLVAVAAVVVMATPGSALLTDPVQDMIESDGMVAVRTDSASGDTVRGYTFDVLRNPLDKEPLFAASIDMRFDDLDMGTWGAVHETPTEKHGMAGYITLKCTSNPRLQVVLDVGDGVPVAFELPVDRLHDTALIETTGLAVLETDIRFLDDQVLGTIRVGERTVWFDVAAQQGSDGRCTGGAGVGLIIKASSFIEPGGHHLIVGGAADAASFSGALRAYERDVTAPPAEFSSATAGRAFFYEEQDFLGVGVYQQEIVPGTEFQASALAVRPEVIQDRLYGTFGSFRSIDALVMGYVGPYSAEVGRDSYAFRNDAPGVYAFNIFAHAGVRLDDGSTSAFLAGFDIDLGAPTAVEKVDRLTDAL